MTNETDAQKQYLNNLKNPENCKLNEQSWAKQNIANFHKSISFFVFKCTACHEDWPLKSKPRMPDFYMCLRCSKDKMSLKSFLLKMK